MKGGPWGDRKTSATLAVRFLGGGFLGDHCGSVASIPLSWKRKSRPRAPHQAAITKTRRGYCRGLRDGLPRVRSACLPLREGRTRVDNSDPANSEVASSPRPGQAQQRFWEIPPVVDVDIRSNMGGCSKNQSVADSLLRAYCKL
jgi:hypothetical protein